MDTSLMSFVLPAIYIKKGVIYQIHFICQNGNLDLATDSDAGRHYWHRESIFTDTFTVEGYLASFFSKYGGRIEYHSKFSLEEDIKRMILAYGNSSLGTWKHLEWNNEGVLEVSENNAIAEMITNSYRDMMNGATMRTLEQIVEGRNNWESEVREREEDEDRG
jgi:hypothetical protein